MSNDSVEQTTETADKSFAEILNEFESTNRAKTPRSAEKGKGGGRPAPKGRGRSPRSRGGAPPLKGTVVGVGGDFVLVDYGGKAEGIIHAGDFRDADGNVSAKVGDQFDVAITGFNSEGMAKLSRVQGSRPRDWDSLTAAYEAKTIVAGRVTGVVKGGMTVDVGARAFLPASRTGIRDAAGMDALVGQEIRVRIIKLDVDAEDLVVDRRSVLEEEAHEIRRNAVQALEEGATVRGTVRSLAAYGAFVDIGGVDGLLHVSDISWSRVTDPASELSVGDTIDVKILKVDKEHGKISLGLKQMTADPWKEAMSTLKVGDRVTGEVTRLADFGAFVAVMPGVEGLIHVSEMSWTRRVQRADEVLKKGERVEAAVLKIDEANGRLSLGLKQVLGNPWDTIKDRYPVGKVVEGKVSRIAKFGAFVELEEGIDGMIHVSEFTSERRIENPSDVVKVGQIVKAAVLSVDPGARRLKLGMKQLEPSATDHFAEAAAVGDRVTGRIVSVRGNRVMVQLGEGVEGVCVVEESSSAAAATAGLSLAEQLAAAWKGGVKPSSVTGAEAYRAGQLRSFTIKSMDTGNRKIELTPA